MLEHDPQIHERRDVASHGVAPVLRPGETCWRIAPASRLAFIIDAADYFSLVKAAIGMARHSVYLIGWEFDLRLRLDPAGARDGAPDTLRKFLRWVANRRPDLRIHVLKWDGAMLHTLGRQIIPFLGSRWFTHDRIRYQLDSEHPPGAAHHQKLIVVDDSVAFCGGMDLTDNCWDTRAHRANDPRRRRSDGQPSGPWHDMATIVEGEVAAALGDLARDRWYHATGERLERPRPGPHVWPDRLRPALRDVDVAIARTRPAYRGRPQIDEIERLYLSAIAAARETIYLESQYFASSTVCAALAARLREPGGPEVVVVNPLSAESWLEAEVMDSARSLAVSDLREADRHGRFGIYRPVNEAGEPIYVHSKTLACDDRFLRVGSSNVNNRSMGFDTECDLAIEAGPQAADAQPIRAAIAKLRDDLLAEHLGITPESFAATRQARGSVLGAIEAVRKEGPGRTLKLLEIRPLNPVERALAESRLLDPERPRRNESHVRHLVKTVLQPFHVRAAVAGGILLTAGLAKIVRRAARRRSKDTS